MAVEAARIALRDRSAHPDQLFFSTTAPAYVDKTNATAMPPPCVWTSACCPPTSAVPYEAGSPPCWPVSAPPAGRGRRWSPFPISAPGCPGSADERRRRRCGGSVCLRRPASEAAPVLAELVGRATATAEFLDRWRTPGAPNSGSGRNGSASRRTCRWPRQRSPTAIKEAELTPERDRPPHRGRAHTRGRRRTFRTRAGVRKEAIAPDLSESIGNPGVAQPGVVLADVLDRAGPEETVVLVVLADGATARCGGRPRHCRITARRSAVAAQIAAGNDALGYPTFLTWRGFLDREPPRRPDPGRARGAALAARHGLEVRFRRLTVHRLPARGTCRRRGSVSTATASTRWPRVALADCQRR